MHQINHTSNKELTNYKDNYKNYITLLYLWQFNISFKTYSGYSSYFQNNGFVCW